MAYCGGFRAEMGDCCGASELAAKTASTLEEWELRYQVSWKWQFPHLGQCKYVIGCRAQQLDSGKVESPSVR